MDKSSDVSVGNCDHLPQGNLQKSSLNLNLQGRIKSPAIAFIALLDQFKILCTQKIFSACQQRVCKFVPCFAKGVSTLLICSLTPSTYAKTIVSLGSFFFPSLFPSFRFFRFYGIAKQIEIRKEGKSEEKKKKEPKDTIVLSYVEGVSEQIKRVLTPLDIRVVNRAKKWTWSLSHGIKDSIPVEKTKWGHLRNFLQGLWW